MSATLTLSLAAFIACAAILTATFLLGYRTGRARRREDELRGQLALLDEFDRADWESGYGPAQPPPWYPPEGRQ